MYAWRKYELSQDLRLRIDRFFKGRQLVENTLVFYCKPDFSVLLDTRIGRR